MSNSVPLLCVSTRLPSRLSNSEMNDTIGPRDGRQASGSSNNTESANVLYFGLQERDFHY